MAFLDKKEIYDAYTAASDEAEIWREHYPEYERLMDNGLMEGLDENLPEVNDGSLAASLFKLAKRVIKKKLGGRPVALDRDDKWINDIADIQWRNNILKNANLMATPRRKWKDAARKAAGYGSQPIITLFVENGNYTGADFIVPYCQDVKLEAGKASDMDSDVIFWDVYYTELQLKNMIEQAENEMKDKNSDGYNKWDVPTLKQILESKAAEDRPGNEEHSDKKKRGVKKNGFHFFIAFQRGVEAPFYMCYPKTKKCVREWSNPDPSGDIPVHYLYFYQDFINPYGIGIVKLAGGTQNVLDYMRQADILATQVGIRPPKLIEGNPDEVDEDSLVYAQDANWYAGNAKVTRMEISNQVYQQLPGRISMYQTSLQKMIPNGDTTISGTDSGDPNVGRTPQALKMQADSLSVDDEDFAENIDECYGLVARSMINIHFANMQGSDLMKLSGEERDVLTKAGIEFPVDENGEPTSELEIKWDNARATFDFELDPDADKTRDEEDATEGMQIALELLKDPATMQLAQGEPMILGTKKVDPGELFAQIIANLTDNDKIVQDLSEEELQQIEEQKLMEQQAIMEQQAMEAQAETPPMDEAQEMVNIEAIMEQYGVPENVARAMREAELMEASDEEIMQLRDALMEDVAQGEVVNG